VVELDFTGELAIVKGDDFSYTFEFQDANCDPIDQTGNTFEATITKNGTLLETFAVSISFENVTISLTEIETAALAVAKHNVKWRLRRTEGTLTTSIVGGDVEIVAV
jgi:hypothetical protein